MRYPPAIKPNRLVCVKEKPGFTVSKTYTFKTVDGGYTTSNDEGSTVTMRTTFGFFSPKGVKPREEERGGFARIEKIKAEIKGRFGNTKKKKDDE